jgi:ribonuclease-3
MINHELQETVEEQIKGLGYKLQFKFRTENQIIIAITRPSYKNENPYIERSDNERMEFLGDSVLKLILSEHLYNQFDDPESKMTEMRSEIEKTDTLALIARKLGIKEYILMSSGERDLSGAGENKVLADTMEAIIGAMYLDSGYEITRKFVKDKILMTLLHSRLENG